MKALNITPPIIAIIPSLVLLPIFIQIIQDFHIGGLSILYNFINASINPSINHEVIINCLKGLRVTFSIAIFSWSISLIIGIILSLFSSYTICRILNIPQLVATCLRRFLTLTRATHELIWGLLLLQIFGLAPWIAIIAIIIPYSSLMARVFSEQIDTLDNKEILALEQVGATGSQIIFTSILPKILPFICTYGSYRLECAFRGATLLGIFGLGGIGNNLRLSIISLNFDEMWTSLWIMFIAIFILEKLVIYIQNPKLYLNNIGKYVLTSFTILIILMVLSLKWIVITDSNFFSSIRFHPIETLKLDNFIYAINYLHWLNLFRETITISFLASSFAIGLPPLVLMFCPNRFTGKVLSLFWIFCRIIPPPFTTLLLLLCTTPSTSVAALALGIQNMGVLGRLLNENINKQSEDLFQSLNSTGAMESISWLYGKFIPQSNSYLIYSIYRADVILRETVVVGVVGGVGLGWQLQESLSSFAWEEVLLVTAAFISISMVGEIISEYFQQHLQNLD